jgi:MoaA/NifB/PqqE/SkfB family radical SAM enzyme
MNNKEEVIQNYYRWWKNFDFEKEKKIFKKKLVKFKPERVYIELTPRCNFNCISCARNYANLDYPDMNLEDFKKIEKNFCDSINIINFTGFGETSLNKDFQKILKYTKEKKYFIEHTSNGSIFNIENMNYIDSLVFSLDGIKKVKEIRKGISNKTIETIKESVKYKNKKNLNTKILINMVLSYKNIDEIEDMFNFCEESKIDHLIIATFVNTPTLYKTLIFDEFEKIISKNLETIDYKKIVDLYSKQNYSFSLTILYPKKKLKGMCVFPFRDFQIDAQGNLILCCRTQANSIKFGNLKKEKMCDILEKKEIKYIKKAHLENLPFEICDRCSVGYPIL